MLVIKIFFVYSLFKIIRSQDNSDEKKLNVVLFLAKPPTEPITCHIGLKYLSFDEKARVKHCAGNGNNNNYNNNNNNINQEEEEQSKSLVALMSPEANNCKELLKAGIFSLISYCRSVMGMTTAIASLENDTFTNGLRFKKSQSEDLEIIYVNPKRKARRDISMYNLFPPKRKMRFNNIKKWSKDKEELITEPEHTEIFKIRSKRNAKPITRKEVKKRCDKDKKKPEWDILGILATLKLTFFGKLLENSNSNDENTNNFDTTESGKGIESIGEVQENTLFDIVKQTLTSIQEVCQSGFLMIVVGGCLKEVSDPYSSLVQSIKHVTENTDDENTLIVVTGYCPENCDSDIKIPVYVRGPPSCTEISMSTELYDIPYTIKNVIADTNIAGSFVSKAKSKRSKREAKSFSKRHFASRFLHFSVVIGWVMIFKAYNL